MIQFTILWKGDAEMAGRIKPFILPKVEEGVMQDVDKKSLALIKNISWVMFLFETVAFIVFILTRREFDEAAMVSIKSVSFCLATCLIAFLVAGKILRMGVMSHRWVELLNASYYLLLSLWAVQVAYRNYLGNEQILTFFAVQIMMVCFVPLNPILSVIFPTVVYSIMYGLFYSVDKGAGINVFNYVLLLVATMTGMVFRFISLVTASVNSLELVKTNDRLFYNSRHDGLTGLRNRKALDEDVHKMIGKHLTAYMIDVNFFKEINDNFGHAVGDRVLTETAAMIRLKFSKDRCYRYGGDEFLILSEGEGSYGSDTLTFCISEVPGLEVLFSIGSAQGTPEDHDDFFRLISVADGKLYEVKERTHSQRS